MDHNTNKDHGDSGHKCEYHSSGTQRGTDKARYTKAKGRCANCHARDIRFVLCYCVKTACMFYDDNMLEVIKMKETPVQLAV